MILVTGALGNVGMPLIKALTAQRQQVRAAVLPSEMEADSQQIDRMVELAVFDFASPLTMDAALAGVDKVFLMRPPAIADVDKYIYPFIDLCQTQGVKHLVFLSLLGAEKKPVVIHHKIEMYILK